MSKQSPGPVGSSRLPAELHHIGIVTSTEQHDGLVDTLVRVLGGVLEYEVEDDPLDVRATWVPISPGLRIEVVSPRSSRRTPITAFLDRHGGGGLHHVSMATAQLGTCKQLLSSSGGVVVGEDEDHGGWAEFFLDPSQTGGALMHWMQAVDM
jgi:methylmalonyl-CoA/ethylmalonyl-CoA epimerase